MKIKMLMREIIKNENNFLIFYLKKIELFLKFILFILIFFF